MPNSFPKAVELWELGDFGNGLIQFEQLTKLMNVNRGTTIKVENFAKSQAKDRVRPSYFSIMHSAPNLQHSHQIRFMHLSDWHIDQLIRGFDQLIQAREIWMQQLIKHPNFLMARLMEQEFDEKQNNDSLQMCEIFDWPHEHLPKISNGKPAPLDEMIIDTRVNPGHWRFKPGYIEGVAAQMWLGDAFFDAVNLDKSALFDVPWLEATELDNGVVHIKAYDTELNSDQGVQRAIQIKLRKLLFGQSLHTEDQTFTQLSEFGN